MEGTLASRKMPEIELIKKSWEKSSELPNRFLKLEVDTLRGNQIEQLEIIIFKGFCSSTTHQIKIDLDKKNSKI